MNRGAGVDVGATMLHRPYPKIHSGDGSGVVGGPWLALEKIHGAHFVVGVDGDRVYFGKRKAWLADDEVFFGWQLLRRSLDDAARVIARVVGADVVVVYGELFGGCYPHPDVDAVPGAQPVQTGVWYCPDVRFAAFDLLVDDVFLGHDDVVAACAAAGVMTPPVLRRGSRSDVERTPVRFTTRVPHLLGLPMLDDNAAEGVVLKPAGPGDASSRALRKRKIDAFAEEKYDEALPFDAGQRLSLDELRRVMRGLVNGPRVASARSKVGEAGDVAAEVVVDVVADVAAAYPAAVAAVGEDVVVDLAVEVVTKFFALREFTRG